MIQNPKPKAWAAKLAACEHRRTKYHELFAADAMTLDKLKVKLGALDTEKALAERELGSIQERRERIHELERDKLVLLQIYRERALKGGLAEFTPQQRHDVYRRMRLSVMVHPSGAVSLDAEEGNFRPGVQLRTVFTLPLTRGHRAVTKSPRYIVFAEGVVLLNDNEESSKEDGGLLPLRRSSTGS